MIAGMDRIRHLLLHHDRADRQTARQRLGRAHQVRLNSISLVRPQVAAAPQAALHFVKDQKRLVLVRQVPQPLQKRRRRRVDAAFPLDRLHDDCAHFVAHLRARVIQVVELGEPHARHQRLERLLVLLPRRGRQRPEQPPVEGVAERQNLILVLVPMLAGVPAGELERALIRAGPAQTEMHLVRKAGLAQLLRQLRVRLSVVQVARVIHAAGRSLLDRLIHLRVAVTENVHRDAGHQVKISLARAVIHRTALALRQHKRRPPKYAKHIILFVLNDFRCVHFLLLMRLL